MTDQNSTWILGTTKVLDQCVACDGYVLNDAEAPHCPTCARLKREELIDAGLTPRLQITNRDHSAFLEAPYERAAHALLDAVGETAVAIWTAPSKEDVLQFRETLDKAITMLNAQSLTAQTLAENWGERGNK